MLVICHLRISDINLFAKVVRPVYCLLYKKLWQQYVCHILAVQIMSVTDRPCQENVSNLLVL